MSAESKFTNKDGTVTRYALACGHWQTKTTDGVNRYYSTDADGVGLSYNGCTYDVHVRQQGVTHDGDFPRWVGVPGYGRTRADWYQFDTLTDARRFFNKAWRMVKNGEAVTDA